ncbi:hypothetical protein B5P44_01375 [Mycobacterium sp. CBMA 213]|uniref:Uncharacterized protein n=1 Tax=Mycolicibacterium sp. CBMA 213 TaxID=1968788 RepID=A0A343VRS2_9MYCO|nr:MULTISPECIES: hypothetical protein [unclassified Mycolicibacterium]AVN58596.1 hypothetical protein B5P44_p00304 [Mycolicibacterium sp. CBMA 213]MUL61233.1 hypothetical protein [Mycolicibacterium sp. CBMA 335]MUM03469.1 hypothetical protein [Mycolicibacterium sp. CBMA 213]
MTQDRLYSVVQTLAPYATSRLVEHRLDFDSAKAQADSLKSGIVSIVPSSDFPDNAKVGDVVES